MERKRVETNAVNEKLVLSKYLLFEWKCLEKQVIGKKIIFEFSRDDTKPYHEELVKLEKEYGEYKIKSMGPSFVFTGLAFLLQTVFFIMFLIDKANILIYFFAISVPGLLCLLVAMIFTLVRFLGINNMTKEIAEKDALYADKIKDLKSKY